MKINIRDIVSHTNQCNYCNHKNKNQFFCNRCNSSNEYYSLPTEFTTEDELVKDYFVLLSEYTKLLNKLGFDIIR